MRGQGPVGAVREPPVGATALGRPQYGIIQRGCVMKKIVINVLMAIITIFLIATLCYYADSVRSIRYWMGPGGPILSILSIVGGLSLLGIIASQALLLHRCIPGERFLGNLWRVTVIFILSKVAEALPRSIFPFADGAINRNSIHFMSSTFMLLVLLMLVAGIVAIAVLIGLLYRRRRPTWTTIAWLSIALECVSISGMFLTIKLLIGLGIMRG